MEVNPLSIILVKSDSKGDRLLFRYPFVITNNESNQKKKRHPYSLITQEDILQSPLPQTSNIHQGNNIFVLYTLTFYANEIVLGQLSGFTDEVLSTLFAVKPELCNQKFELKVSNLNIDHPSML